MLRSLFISLSRAAWAQRAIPRLGLVKRMAGRFVAGETAEEAIEVIRQLNARGINATLDHLGENTTSADAACQAADEVVQMLAAMERAGVSANVSIKLSQMGLTIDPELCRQNVKRLLDQAQALGSFIRIDMEDSSLTEATLDVYFWARQQGYEQVGIVLQAYLYRSEADLRKILGLAGRVRLCKGAYNEPPQIAYPQKADVDQNYDRLAGLLMEGALQAGNLRLSSNGRIPPIPALATHDEKRIQTIRAMAERLKLPKDAFEFQMLYGIRRDLQEKLAAAGYPVRVYVPYGTHWYPYFMRRLGERPANLWFLASNFLRK
jgi:proline dehydrogenase